MYEQKDEPGSSHNLLRHYLAKLPENAKVLDIGTATGILGRLSKDFPLKLYGVEPNLAWAEQAKPYYEQIFVGQLEEAKEEFLSDYDMVVCADVLEHMVDPHAQLSRLVRLQAPHTSFIICAPNIANIWIRINLLMGKFEYTDKGILDRTHLRFFTLKTLKELLSSSGLVIEKIKPTPIPLTLIHPFFASTFIGRSIRRMFRFVTRPFPTLLGYQFFCLAYTAPAEKLWGRSGDFEQHGDSSNTCAHDT